MRSFALLFVAVLWIAGPSVHKSEGQGWNGILPLHSTRAEVEQRLGSPEGECRCIYRTKNEIVFIDYAEAVCKGPIHGWNVPADTVLQFTVTPKAKPLFSDPSLDNSKYVKTNDDPITINYTNVQEGIQYTVQNGQVLYIKYIPSSKDNNLRCAGFPSYSAEVAQYRPYDSFTKKSKVVTFARLDNFALQLLTSSIWKGYIIAYAGKVSKQGEAKVMAEKAKQYLINKHKISPHRIVAIDGGYKETAEFELYLIQNNMLPPRPIPTLSLSEVQIISNNKR
ncbi:MAG: hypothetical protein ACJ74W_07620 [Pyrinomonadaceae bacterium]